MSQPNENVIFLYHLGLTWLAKVDIVLNKEEKEALAQRFLNEATRDSDLERSLRLLTEAIDALLDSDHD